MSLNTDNKLSFIYERVIPAFVREDHPEYTEIVVAYFEYLERINLETSPIDLGEYSKIQNLLNLRDIDETLDSFLDKYRFSHTALLPKVMVSDFRFIVKMIKSFYQTKGSEESFKLFFEMVFNADVEFVYPKESILRASDGKWTDPRYILVDPDSIVAVDPLNPSLAEVKVFTDVYVQGQFPLVGIESNASGIGEEYIHISPIESNSKLISLSNVAGTFIAGEFIFPLGFKDPNDDPFYNPLKQQQLITLITDRDVKKSIRDGFAVSTSAWNSANSDYIDALVKLDDFESTLFYMVRINKSETLVAQGVDGLERLDSKLVMTAVGHGYKSGDRIQITGADRTEYNVIHTIFVIDDDTYEAFIDATDFGLVDGITQVGGVATVDHTGHGYKTGDFIQFNGSDQVEYNVYVVITVLDTDTYTFIVNAGTTSPATGDSAARLVREDDAGTMTSIPVRSGNTWQDGYIDNQPGHWVGDDGKVSSTMFLQDSDFWQDFSYLLKSEIHISNFIEPILTNLHPAGFKLFSELVAGDGTLITGSKPKLIPSIDINGDLFGLIEWLIEWIVELFDVDARIPEVNSIFYNIATQVQLASNLPGVSLRDFERDRELVDSERVFSSEITDNLRIDTFDESHGHLLTFVDGTKQLLSEYDLDTEQTWIGSLLDNERLTMISLADGFKYAPEHYTLSSNIIKINRPWNNLDNVNAALIFTNGLENHSAGRSQFASDVNGIPDVNGSYLSLPDGQNGDDIEIFRLDDNSLSKYSQVIGTGSVIQLTNRTNLDSRKAIIFINGLLIQDWKISGSVLSSLTGSIYPAGILTIYTATDTLVRKSFNNLSGSTITSLPICRQESIFSS